MVKDQEQDILRTRAKQGVGDVAPEPNRINASTPYDFGGRNLTAYGGLLPVATMLERLGFRQLVEETLTVKRKTKAMALYQFVLAMVLACYVGFSRLYHLRFLEREPMLTGILQVLRLPPQSTFWRFLASLHLGVARQLLQVQRRMRERVWEAANVQLTEVTLDTDTTVHTLFGNQMGARKSYNPKSKGKKSFQPILTFVAETKEYVSGALRSGDRPDGKDIAAHLDRAVDALPATVKTARASSPFFSNFTGADAGSTFHPAGAIRRELYSAAWNCVVLLALCHRFSQPLSMLGWARMAWRSITSRGRSTSGMLSYCGSGSLLTGISSEASRASNSFSPGWTSPPASPARPVYYFRNVPRSS